MKNVDDWILLYYGLHRICLSDPVRGNVDNAEMIYSFVLSVRPLELVMMVLQAKRQELLTTLAPMLRSIGADKKSIETRPWIQDNLMKNW